MKRKINLKAASWMMLFAVSAIPLFAQPGQGQRPGAGQGVPPGSRGRMNEETVKARVERLAESVELTADQKQKILDFEMEMFRKSRTEFQKMAGDREAIRSFMQGQREQRNKKYTEVLTREQMEKYQELQQQRMQQRRPGEGPGSQGQGQRGRGGN